MIDHKGVHITHCCLKHGCKYLDEDCPVVNREAAQQYLCEDCDYDGYKSIGDMLNDTPKEFSDLDKVKKVFDEIRIPYQEIVDGIGEWIMVKHGYKHGQFLMFDGKGNYFKD